MFRFLMMNVCLCVCTAGHVWAQDEEDLEPQIVMRVYKIGDLVTIRPDFKLESRDWPGVDGLRGKPKPEIVGTSDGGMGGGYGGGMGGVGAGGMMRIPDDAARHIQPQMGGMGGMGGGMGGMGGGMWPTGQNSGEWEKGQGMDPRVYAEVLQAIESIDPDNWESMGGLYAMRPYRDSLIIHTTEETHEKIGQLLEVLRENESQQPQLKLEWVVVSAEGETQLDIEDMVKGSIANGSMSCNNLQTVFSTSGMHVNFVMGTSPVVGGESSIGYQPMVTRLFTGWAIEIRPNVHASKRATMDVVATYTTVPESAEMIDHTPDVRLDRVSLQAVELTGTVVGASGQWLEVASFAHGGDAVAEGLRQKIRLFVRWEVVE